jgi:hypothetical protein
LRRRSFFFGGPKFFARPSCTSTHPPNPHNSIIFLPYIPQPKNQPTTINKQLRHVLTNIGEKLSPQEMDALVAEADTKGDGRVEREAFVRLLMAK